MLYLLIVGDVDTRATLIMRSDVASRYAELIRLAHHLSGDGERREMQDIATCGSADRLPPCQFHQTFAEASASKQRGPAAL
ncbi:hypothetical protein J5277_09565 [Rhizobium sp. 16-449-1b]|nr:hypothetical protein [Rhizobium sp. 16-449-1b]